MGFHLYPLYLNVFGVIHLPGRFDLLPKIAGPAKAAGGLKLGFTVVGATMSSGSKQDTKQASNKGFYIVVSIMHSRFTCLLTDQED